MSDDLFERLQQSTNFIREKIGDRRPTVGLVLGSGLGGFADTLEDRVSIAYGEIPHFPISSVVGHAGQLVVGRKRGTTCVAMQGRVHFYEGHSAKTIVFPARTMVTLGAKNVIITNAAGGLAHDPGTLMLIRDHINFFPDNPLKGENDERLGPRFPDMTHAYSPVLMELAHAAAKARSIELAAGVYAGLPGPSYETPAEIKMLGVIGADAAGMSTIPEVIAVNHMGASVLGISCITNKAAGISGEPLSHEEVTNTATGIRSTFEGLLDEILSRLNTGDTE